MYSETALRKIDETYSDLLRKYNELTKCSLSIEDSKKYVSDVNGCFRKAYNDIELLWWYENCTIPNFKHILCRMMNLITKEDLNNNFSEEELIMFKAIKREVKREIKKNNENQER